MLMTEEAELRAAVEALGEAKTARRYDDALRRRVVRHARARLREGATAKEIAASLDVSVLSLHRFLEQIPELVPVTVVDVEPVGAPSVSAPSPSAPVPWPSAPAPAVTGSVAIEVALPPVPRTVTVHGPHGLRIEGLTIDDVVVLFQRMATCSA